MTVSVIVPAYNAQKTLGWTLEALLKQNFSEQYEIIVVNDGSFDQTAEIIHSFPSVGYAYQDNTGPAAARNHGARLAKGDFLAFTDSDCIPHKDWLSFLMKGFVASDVGVVMGSYGIANSQNLLAFCVYKEIVFRHVSLLSDFPKVFGSYNFCVKKNVFDQVGGFDSSYHQASGEDNDLSYKIIASGCRIYFQRKALVDHYHPTRIQTYLKEQFRHGFWRVMMYLNHPVMTKGDGYTFWKDMIEVPWSLACLLGFIITLFGLMSYKSFVLLYITPFLIFQFYFAHRMLYDIRKDFFWGFVMFLRSFSRVFGLSTGVLYFFLKKKLNKS